MRKRTATALVLALAFVLALPAAAMAQSEASSSDATVAGRGWLKARGTGTAEVEMAGFMRLRLGGDVVIVDHAGDLKVTVRGQGIDARRQQTDADGRIVLSNFDGVIKLKGSHFEVAAEGQMVIKAKGMGKATLTGEGVFRTRRGPWRTWNGNVLPIGAGLDT